MRLRQTAEAQRTERQAEVAQRDVEVLAEQEQVGDDAPQPAHHDVRTDARYERHEHAGKDLDDTDAVHKGTSVDPEHVREDRREIDGPVGEQVEELIESRNDGSDDETGVQDAVRLPEWVRHAGCVEAQHWWYLLRERFPSGN